MKISHKILNVSGLEQIYIYITVEDIYEFAKENLDSNEDTDFLNRLRKYIKDNFKNKLFSSAFIVINGILIGSLSLASIYSTSKGSIQDNTPTNKPVYTEIIQNGDNKDNNSKIDIYAEKISKEETIEKDKNETTPSTPIITDKYSNKTETAKPVAKKDSNKTSTTTSTKKKTNTNKNTSTTAKKQTTTTNSQTNATANKNTTTTKPSSTTSNSTKPTTSNTTAKPTTTKPQTNTSNANSNTSTNTPTQIIPSSHKIKLNNNGSVITIGLEDYIIGVVAAEMPASFNIEALKAQAVVARTYAMKKAEKGTILQNSTYHQVYNTANQMKARWGSSFNTYYNKIKNAVSSTKGEVLKYNGTYIEALYFSMSNGKTELPSYVWTTDYPYLKVVNSSWDENISGSKYTMNFSYATLSEKLGVTVNKDSSIVILSKTPGNRINEISIAGKVFKGTKLKALLGLRSTDFSIIKTDTGFTITTIGFGHGVGMSQYGANGAAKSGMTYRQILNHYYPGVSLVKI